jgi:hypothetical protein
MLITGRPEEVIAAQYLVWDNVSLHASEDGFGTSLLVPLFDLSYSSPCSIVNVVVNYAIDFL